MSEGFPDVPELVGQCPARRKCFLDFTYYLECDDWCERHNLLRTERKYGEPYQYSIRMGIGAGNAIRIYDDDENRIDLESEEKRIATSNSLGTLFEVIGSDINSKAPNDITELAFHEINYSAPDIKTTANRTLLVGITPCENEDDQADLLCTDITKYEVIHDPNTQCRIYMDGDRITLTSTAIRLKDEYVQNSYEPICGGGSYVEDDEETSFINIRKEYIEINAKCTIALNAGQVMINGTPSDPAATNAALSANADAASAAAGAAASAGAMAASNATEIAALKDTIAALEARITALEEV
jgi:hypothetical protein